MLTFLRTRLPIITALILTLFAFYALLSRQSFDAAWMLKWNHVDSGQVQVAYGVLIVVLILALPVAMRIQAVLRRGRFIVFIAAVAASFLSISLLEPNQEHRLFVSPFSIWVMIVHIVSVSAVFVWFTTQPTDTADRSLSNHRQMLLGCALVMIIGVLGVLYYASRADFIPLDLPDEPFNASIATNYAENNDLSSTYIGSAYGSPDVVFPRYYWVMGVWLKVVGSTSLAAQRSFPVLVSFLALATLMLAMWRMRHQYGLRPLNVVIAAVALLSMSTFLRTSHDLRMDILLAVYSSLMLWGMLGFWGSNGQTGKGRYLILMGVALFLGMESIPLAAVPISLATGMMLMLWWVCQPQKRDHLHYVIIYASVCIVGILAYYLFQFVPNIAEGYGRYRAFVQSYSSVTGVGSLQLPIANLINYIGRFNLVLSPVELLAAVVAMVALWRLNVSAERWMLATVGLGFVLLAVVFRLSYSYMVVFAPFVAYAIGRVSYPWRRATSPLIVVCLAALVAVPIFDLKWSIEAQPNQTRLESLSGLTPQFPPGTTIVGEDVFWFTLQDQRTYIGINGLANYVAIKQVDNLTALKTLKVDALLCDSGTAECKALVDTGYFDQPTEYKINNSTYLVYWHSNS